MKKLILIPLLFLLVSCGMENEKDRNACKTSGGHPSGNGAGDYCYSSKYSYCVNISRGLPFDEIASTWGASHQNGELVTGMNDAVKQCMDSIN